MIRRPRLVAVLALVGAGAVLVIAATQTWVAVRLVEGDTLPVSGGVAVPVLVPLALAAVAAGLALTVAGLVLRYVLGLVAVAIGVVVAVPVTRVAVTRPLDAVAGTVTDATGIAGDGVVDLVAGITATAWPWIALAASVVVAVGGGLVLATGRGWTRGGRRFDTTAETTVERPRDTIDSWDDLSRGADPTV